ncbi:Glutathione transferase GST 23 [Linum grandiflorum]
MTTLSPFATRIVWALQLKGVEFEAIEEDLDNKSSSLLRYNPIHKKIPVLVHNGEPVVESLVILEYIDSVWNQTCPLLPADPYQRALARFWAKFVDGKVTKTFALYLRDKEGEEAAVEEARGNLKFMEKELESSGGFNNKFFGGDNVGMVDLAFGSVVFLVDVVEQLRDQLHDQKLINEVNFPLLAQWKDRLSGIDVIRNSLPPADQVAAVLQARQAAN